MKHGLGWHAIDEPTERNFDQLPPESVLTNLTEAARWRYWPTVGGSRICLNRQ